MVSISKAIYLPGEFYSHYCFLEKQLLVLLAKLVYCLQHLLRYRLFGALWSTGRQTSKITILCDSNFNYVNKKKWQHHPWANKIIFKQSTTNKHLGALGNELTSFFKVFTKQSIVLLYVGSPIILDLTCQIKQIESFSRLHPRCIKALLFPWRAFLKLIKRLANTEEKNELKRCLQISYHINWRANAYRKETSS